MTQAPAGWYPLDDGTQRYWDGAAWTEHVAPGTGVPVPQQPVVPQAPVVPEVAQMPIPEEAPLAPVVAEVPQASPVLAVPPAAAQAPNAYAAAPAPASYDVTTAKPKRRVWPWIVGIGGGLIVIGVVAVIVVVMVVGKALSGPKDVASEFNDAYFAGDCETYLDVTTEGFRESDSFPGTCEEAADWFFPTVDEDTFSITLDGVSTSGSNATVTGTMTSTEYGEGVVTYGLIKVDGEWKVDSIESAQTSDR